MDIAEDYNVVEDFEELPFNIFLQHAVIKNLYKYLSLDEIKNSRFVCREWNSTALLFLRARSKIVFGKEPENVNFVPSQFLEDFADTLHIPFTAFAFKNGNNWKIDELSEFFTSQQNCIQELDLDCINITNGNDIKENSFDITNILRLCTKLSISCCKGTTTMIIPLDKLLSVKDLSLCGCQVNLCEGIKLSPIKLVLENIRVYQDKYAYREMCINDIVDFSKCKYDSMECLNYSMANTLFTLDLLEITKSVNLDCLCLHSITVVNWQACTWNINNLDLWDVPLVEKIGIQIQNLSFKFSEIDLAVLPQTIKTLAIKCISDMGTRVFCSQPIVLPNLSYLHLGVTNTDYTTVISHFKNCANLTNIYLEGCESAKSKWKLNCIPKSVKRMKFTCSSLDASLTENQIFHLEKLILYDRKYNAAIPFFEKNIFVEELILFCFEESLAQEGFISFLNSIKSKIGQRIYAGPFIWDKNDKNITITNLVDKQAKYYVLESHGVIAITENEFQKNCNLVPLNC